MADPGATHRRIRSFVRRASRMTASQRRALEVLWPDYGVDDGPGPLDFEALFGRRAPTVLEIGFGNGETLVAQAAAAPQHDFLGIEVHEPGIGHCLIAARDAGIDNLRLVAGDAVEILRDRVGDATLARINLYFPDPWPKKRHHKRRIVQPDFLAHCAECLQADGTLHVATDWADYAEHIDAAIAACPQFRTLERRVHDGESPLARPRTKFERRGLARGHRIYDWRFGKTDL